MARFRTAGATALTLLACAGPGAAPAPACAGARVIATLPPEIREASGIALSRRQPGVFWIHNDSKRPPVLYAIDAAGRVLATSAVSAPASSDWEDIGSGPCPAGFCLYLADTGDNLHEREDRAILRIAEPDPGARTLDRVERFPFRFPDGPRDAEGLVVMPDTTLYIITKGRSGPVTVYRYPPPLRPLERVSLQPVQRLSAGLEQLPDLVTGAAASADGSRVAVRTYTHLQLYRFVGDTLAPLLAGRGYPLETLREPQGEGVALTDDGTVFLVSEAGPAGAAAPLSRLHCPH